MFKHLFFTIMQVNQVIDDFVHLGKRFIDSENERAKRMISQASIENPWFTQESVLKALKALSYMLQKERMLEWLQKYDLKNEVVKNIGIVMAGNIPLVGFHDLMCVLVTGNKGLVKLSSQDRALMEWVIEELVDINSIYEFTIETVDKVNNADAVIATGSDNTARYFEYYFREIPHILRKNRTSVAILRGDESDLDLKNMADDIFSYYGLGCRNVSKLLVPEGYDFEKLGEAFKAYEYVVDFHKYANNYNYNKTIYLMNQAQVLDFGHILLTASDEIVSPIGVCFYEYFRDENELNKLLKAHETKIQVVVGDRTVSFGQAQKPNPWDYADNVDTIEFLRNL